MDRPDAGFASARLFRWQQAHISQVFQNEFEKEPLSRKDGPLLRPLYDSRGVLGRWHRGVDLAVPAGTPVRLVLSGWVALPPFDPVGFGLALQCYGARYVTTYGHLSVIRASSGSDRVHGDLVALSGNTGNSDGPHIHWELWDSQEKAWIDPWLSC